jgi:arylsulfatase A-like enzyme
MSGRFAFPQAFLGLVAAGLVLLGGSAIGAGEKTRPNIVFILADDLGWQDVGFAGNRQVATPHLDRLAREGVIFSQAYASAPNCAPTRACLLSGQVTPRHRVFTVVDSRHDPGQPGHKILSTASQDALPDATDTIAEVLHQGGYATALVGMWNLGRGRSGPGSPAGQGFDLYRNPKHLGFDQDAYRDERGRDLTEVMTDEALAFVGKHRQQPFFLYFAPHAVHGPFDPPPDLLEKYRQQRTDEAGINPAYAATIEQLDRQIGRLMKQLEEWDLARNTVVIFTSDNGGDSASVAPLKGGKGTLYEGGLRVPALVWGHGVGTGGRVCDQPIQSIDFFPTLLELSGVERGTDQPLDGISLVPALQGEELPRRESLFWHFPCYVGRGRPSSAVRQGDWKLIENFEDQSLELYNLRQDPGERRDLAKQEPEQARALAGVLHDWQQRVNAPRPSEPNPQYDPTQARAGGRGGRRGGPGGGAREGGGPRRGPGAGQGGGQGESDAPGGRGGRPGERGAGRKEPRGGGPRGESGAGTR